MTWRPTAWPIPRCAAHGTCSRRVTTQRQVENPRELIRDVLELKGQITAGLEKLLREIDS